MYYLRFAVKKYTIYKGEIMRYTEDQMAEIDILIHYQLDTTQQGIKVHSSANRDQIDAVQRLYAKGLVTQKDGGYLTDIGRKAAEHAQALVLMLAPHQQSMAS